MIDDDNIMGAFAAIGVVVVLAVFFGIIVGVGYLWGANDCNTEKPDHSTPTQENPHG